MFLGGLLKNLSLPLKITMVPSGGEVFKSRGKGDIWGKIPYISKRVGSIGIGYGEPVVENKDSGKASV